ncbi:MAG: aminomethyl transferase family protein [Candidatus Cloacimonetes bacterium]|nr:aminomethyl transferase family protein [Candidatus Cloacimonadota bacterium]MCF7814935.1 aminomethyl transferase family protein [Candidatus Cloacimonadota bacterium]MCF7868139.1 aminomethyl transferase family protein [Candidatus Cloacimonadota bacterium]MCF7883605.1 aminomethyl transferase family protein [Candidatus Cloacimonadota bacterium]
MNKIGFDFPSKPRKTALFEVENWYQKLLSERLDRPYSPIKTSNFGEYDMAVNYLTSVLEEAKAIDKVAVFNIDHMAQIQFKGKDALNLLDRVLPANVESMKIGQCKYTLLLMEEGTVLDDLIIMRISDDEFILVINAGHDITDEEKGLIADADFILKYKKDDEELAVKDISDRLVKIDIQGPLSFKLIKNIYGEEVLKNRNKPEKNMRFFTFNEFEYDGEHYLISRTGYTNRWGWELYVPAKVAQEQFRKIALEALELGGLVVGLGGRDENRISAGNVGLPLNGSEYDRDHTPVNSPLFGAAIDMGKENFVGKKALEAEIASGTDKHMVLFISEGIVSGRGIYKDGKRWGTVTSSINSPNVSQEKREFIGSARKNVLGENGTAAIGLGWVYTNPFEVDEKGNDIVMLDDEPVRIRVEFYREDENRNPIGKRVLGYISGDGVTPATAPKPLKQIQNL